jgi:8-oxo-dGTP pyrophosphatase MutT (NUDIX family)
MTVGKNAHGAIARAGETVRDNYLFRVSLKAVIFNDDGQVLVVKERGRDWWDIPGGGIDHGEAIKEALARELNEEVSLQGDFTYMVLLAEDPRYLGGHNFYQMRITFLVRPNKLSFGVGKDSDEVKFVDPAVFESSDVATERKIFEYCQLAKNR